MSILRLPDVGAIRPGSFIIHPATADALGPLRELFSVSQSTVYPLANRCIFVPFKIEKTAVAYNMFTQAGSAVSGNIDVGLYTSGMVSLTTLGSTAQANVSDITVHNITDTILLPGRYYMGLSCDNITATFPRWSTGPRHLRMMGCLEKTGTFPLPTGTVTTSAVASGDLQLFGVVLQTVA